MSPSRIIASIVVCVGAALAFLLFVPRPGAPTYALQPTSPEVVALGKKVYDEHCASCHGANLEGQPNWRIRDENWLLPAPPHDETGHTWHHADEVLFLSVKHGPGYMLEDYESNMPGYADILSDEEIVASLSFIASTWPPEVLAEQQRINKGHEDFKEQ